MAGTRQIREQVGKDRQKQDHASSDKPRLDFGLDWDMTEYRRRVESQGIIRFA